VGRLRNFDFRLYKFNVISVERPSKKLQTLLYVNGYRFLYMMAIYGDCIFIHKSNANYASLISKYHAITLFYWEADKQHGNIYNITM
jgi:hypothetical protein